MSDLLTPDRSIVSLDEARNEKEAAKKRPGKGKMGDFVTREELMMAVGKGALALGQKMYDQVSGEIAENFVEQEARIIGLVERRFQAIALEREAQTPRGRWRRLVRWIRIQGGWVPPVDRPALVAEPEHVTAPVGTKEAAIAELRRRITAAEDGADIEVPDGISREEALAIAAEVDAEVRDAVASLKASSEGGKTEEPQ